MSPPKSRSSAESLACNPASSYVFAADPSKAFFERFSLIWAPISMVILLAGLFGTGLYAQCGRDEYLAVSLLICLPGVVYPVLFPDPCDSGRPYADRFWVKASVWIAIFSFYGNYFWTHYFYTILGAEYLFDSYLFNNVPVVTYLCTFFYFTFYFSFINVTLRAVKRYISSIHSVPSPMNSIFGSVLWILSIFVAAVGTAIFEAVSILHFPLYTYKDRFAFLTVGSVFYGIYFMVGFPMFFALDEDVDRGSPKQVCFENTAGSLREGDAQSGLTAKLAEKTGKTKPFDVQAPPVVNDDGRSGTPKSLWYFAQNSLAAVAIVTLGLDLWRLFLGDIYSLFGMRSDVLGERCNEIPFIAQLGSFYSGQKL
jgi:cycloeucalenol cycloisomerase